MDKKVALKWADELETGKWLQGQGALKTRNEHEKSKHCCLGVLCEIQGLKSYYRNDSDIYSDQTYFTYDGEEFFVPKELSQEVGLSRKGQDILSCLNDNGEDFLTIAKYIRNNYGDL